MIWNFCPGCGHRIYQHGSDGCQHVDQIYHVASLVGDSTTVKHPAREREDDKLFECGVLAAICALPDRPKPVGHYCVTQNGDGAWVFSPERQAYRQCTCTLNPWFFEQLS
jgi:hypothetical protein